MKETLQTVAAILSETGVRALVVGGVAVSQYEVTRLTFDLDLAVTESDENILSDALNKRGFTRIHRTSNFARFKPRTAGFIVDILFLDSATFETMWAKAVDTRLSDRIFHVAAPEHLICMKLHALHHGSAERLDRDVSDILRLMSKCGWTPTSQEFIDSCAKYGTDSLHELLRKRWPS